MPRLLVDGRDVAPLEVADTVRVRMRGLLGRDGIDGALWLEPANGIHTLGMRFAIDVAMCDREGRVLRLCTVVPNRLTRPVRSGRITVEAAAGAMAAWEVTQGTVLATA